MHLQRARSSHGDIAIILNVAAAPLALDSRRSVLIGLRPEAAILNDEMMSVSARCIRGSRLQLGLDVRPWDRRRDSL